MYNDERFRLLMDHVPILIWCADGAGCWAYVNQRWTEFTGRDASRLLGWDWLELVHADEAAAVLDEITMRAAKREAFQIEFRLRRHDGQYRSLTCSGVPRIDRQGDCAGFAGYCMDLTDIRQAERDRSRHAKEMSAMLHELHHRVKNNAQVFASLLSVQASRSPDPAVKAGLRAAVARAATIAQAQQQIWDSLASDHFDLRALVQRIARSQRAAGASVEVAAPDPIALPLAMAVPLALIVHELLSNAVRHAQPEAGAAREVGISLRRAEDRLELEVTDNGADWSDGEAERAPSTGLTIVRSLARQLGARLSCEWDRGTRIRLSLSDAVP